MGIKIERGPASRLASVVRRRLSARSNGGLGLLDVDLCMRVGGLSIPVDLLPLGMAESDRGHEESEPHLSRAEARVVYEAMPHRRQRTTVEPKLTRSRLETV